MTRLRVGAPLLLALAHCGDASAPHDHDGRAYPLDATATHDARARDDDARDRSDDNDDNDAALPEMCRPRDGGTDDAASNARCIRELRGTVSDLAGAPLAGLAVTLCGPVCFFGETDATGLYRLTPNARLDPSLYVLRVHARPSYAPLDVPAPATWTGDRVEPFEPVRLPRYELEGDPIADGALGGTSRAGPLTLTIAPDTTLELDVEDAALGPLGSRLRLARVALDRAPRFTSEARLELLFALAPFNLTANRPIAVRVENTLRWAPGTRVELIALGNRLLEPPIDGGRPLRVATAQVTADGASVETLVGEGLRVINWLGLRRAAP